MNPVQLREEVDASIASGDVQDAARKLKELWNHERSPSAAAYLVARYEQLRSHLSLLPYRVAILRSFTLEPIVPLFRASAFAAGIDLRVYLSEFNAYAQEILDPQSAMYKFKPDAAILAVQTRDVAPGLWRNITGLEPQERQSQIERVAADFSVWIRTFREHSQSHFIVHSLEQPAFSSAGILDDQLPGQQQRAIEQINCTLRSVAASTTGTYVLDYDTLVARHGRLNWHDERRWLTVRLPIAGPHLHHMSEEWMRFLHPLTGKIAKCLVVDLDNTLWGGVIGEDGMSGIQLSAEHPGAAYQELQRVLVDLRRRGILLAICSKNNFDDAMQVIKNHSGMLLRESDFSAIRVNWFDKAQNLREIAAELNIGLDSLAFLDDNPIERRQIRTILPEVAVIELPKDPASYARVVRECPVFERLTLSREDRNRGAMYREQNARADFEAQSSSLEDFYRSLQQKVQIDRVNKTTLPRVSQLINKTNQFNLTTRRYTQQQIEALIGMPGWTCFSLRVQDRFGDNGLVAVAITHTEGEVYEIDTLLMSCRVIGRTVETAFLSFLIDHARSSKARLIQGWLVPTKKNAPAADFYRSHGFAEAQRDGESSLWGLTIANSTVTCPEWISLQVPGGDLNS